MRNWHLWLAVVLLVSISAGMAQALTDQNTPRNITFITDPLNQSGFGVRNASFLSFTDGTSASSWSSFVTTTTLNTYQALVHGNFTSLFAGLGTVNTTATSALTGVGTVNTTATAALTGVGTVNSTAVSALTGVGTVNTTAVNAASAASSAQSTADGAVTVNALQYTNITDLQTGLASVNATAVGAVTVNGLQYTNITAAQAAIAALSANDSSFDSALAAVSTLAQSKGATGSVTGSTCLQNITVTNTSITGQYVACGSGSDGNNYTVSASVTGTTTKTLNLAFVTGSNITATWTDVDTVFDPSGLYTNVTALQAFRDSIYTNTTLLQAFDAAIYTNVSGVQSSISTLQTFDSAIYVNVTALQTFRNAIYTNVTALQTFDSAIYVNVTNLQTGLSSVNSTATGAVTVNNAQYINITNLQTSNTSTNDRIDDLNESKLNASGITYGLINSSLLNSTDTPAAGEILSYASNGQFTWVADQTGGGGAISGLTAGRVPYATNSTNIADGSIRDNGTAIAIGTSVESGKTLSLSGRMRVGNILTVGNFPQMVWNGDYVGGSTVAASTGPMTNMYLDISAGNFLLQHNGSVTSGSAPSWNTIMNVRGDNTITLGTGGTQGLTVNSTAGRIGVGTSTPAYDLEVIGDANVSSILYTPQVCLAGDCRTAWPSGSGGNTTAEMITAVNTTGYLVVENYTVAAAVTGTTTKTLQLDQSVGNNITASWTDLDTVFDPSGLYTNVTGVQAGVGTVNTTATGAVTVNNAQYVNITNLQTSNTSTNSALSALSTFAQTKAATGAQSIQCSGTNKVSNITVTLTNSSFALTTECTADDTGSGGSGGNVTAITNGTGGFIPQFSNSTNLNNSAIYCKSDGDCAIGTTSTTDKLTIQSTAAYDGIRLMNNIATQMTWGNSTSAQVMSVGFSSNLIGGSDRTFFVYDNIADTSRFYINSAGNALFDENVSIDNALNVGSGGVDSAGDVYASANSATSSSPRIFGFNDLSSGEAVRFQFGDNSNAIQNLWGGGLTMYAYHPIVISGSTGTVGPPSYQAEDTTRGVIIYSGNTNPTTLVVRDTTGGSAPIQTWESGSNVSLGNVSDAGTITIDGNFSTKKGSVFSGSTISTLEVAAVGNKMTFFESDFQLCNANSFTPLLGSAASSGTIIAGTGTAARPGVCGFRDSTTAAGAYRINSESSAFLINGSEYVVTIFSPGANRHSGTSSEFAMWGFSDTTTYNAAPTDGCAFRRVNWNWSGFCANSSVVQYTASNFSSFMYDADWYISTMEVNPTATSVNFTLYNMTTGTILWSEAVTARIPVISGRETGFILIAGENSTNAAAGILEFDYVRLGINREIARTPW